MTAFRVVRHIPAHTDHYGHQFDETTVYLSRLPAKGPDWRSQRPYSAMQPKWAWTPDRALVWQSSATAEKHAAAVGGVAEAVNEAATR